ncbi:MAG TPA: amidohydrolase [Devosiaceae bacterium]|jgi:predicted TIM-barrel fold metal-dependent hydrolase
MRILDTHLHLIYKDRFSYPWLATKPVLDRQWPAEDYFAEAIPLGIEAALHMEVDVAESDMLEETRFVTQLHKQVIGAIAAARPEHADFPAYLEEVSAIPHVRGIRRILHEVPDAVSETPLFAENIRRLAGYNLPFDLCLRADQLPIGLALVKKAPDVQFILDHCGNPDIASNAVEPWLASIRDLAALPNIAAKISGIATNARPGWTAETLQPFVEHVIESFGWDRVVWGSDRPVLSQNGTLARWVEATRAIIAGASADEQAKLLYRNAERLYRL